MLKIRQDDPYIYIHIYIGNITNKIVYITLWSIPPKWTTLGNPFNFNYFRSTNKFIYINLVWWIWLSLQDLFQQETVPVNISHLSKEDSMSELQALPWSWSPRASHLETKKTLLIIFLSIIPSYLSNHNK